MKSFNSKYLALLGLLCFLFSIGISTVAEASGKRNPEAELKALREELRNAQRELRRLNEEGGPEAQERAQQLMERIVALRERIAELENSSSL